jgi:hypothetical protein
VNERVLARIWRGAGHCCLKSVEPLGCREEGRGSDFGVVEVVSYVSIFGDGIRRLRTRGVGCRACCV